MNAPFITPSAVPLFQLRPEYPRVRRSLIRVLWSRFLGWIEKASWHAIRKASLRALAFVAIVLGVLVPEPMISAVAAVGIWHESAVPKIFGIVAILIYLPVAVRFVRRRALKARGENQHTFHGVPVGELAGFLKQSNSWKRDEAIAKFGISQGQYHKIAEELKRHELLFHGEKNAHVLRDIGLALLIQQLRALAEGKAPPLVFDPERLIWVERDGMFARHVLDAEFRRRKIGEENDRAERKLERTKRKIEEASAIASFAQ